MTSREVRCLARRYAGEMLKASAARAESKFTAENGVPSNFLPDFWREVGASRGLDAFDGAVREMKHDFDIAVWLAALVVILVAIISWTVAA